MKSVSTADLGKVSKETLIFSNVSMNMILQAKSWSNFEKWFYHNQTKHHSSVY